MGVAGYLVDLDRQVIIIEWELLPGQSTRLCEIVPTDRITVRDLYGRAEATVERFADWGENRGIHVYLADGGIVHVDELVAAWSGCWLD